MSLCAGQSPVSNESSTAAATQGASSVFYTPHLTLLCPASSKASTQLSSRQPGHQRFPEGWGTSHPGFERPENLCRNSTSGCPLEPGNSRKGALMAKGCKRREAGQTPSSDTLTWPCPHWDPSRKPCGCSQLVHERAPTKAMIPHRSHSLCC